MSAAEAAQKEALEMRDAAVEARKAVDVAHTAAEQASKKSTELVSAMTADQATTSKLEDKHGS